MVMSSKASEIGRLFICIAAKNIPIPYVGISNGCSTKLHAVASMWSNLCIMVIWSFGPLLQEYSFGYGIWLQYVEQCCIQIYALLLPVDHR